MKIPTPTTGEISLYFHIPFCQKKCSYCHFYVIQNSEEKQKLLTKALLLEIKQKAPLLKDKKIVSIYLGGGTPFLLQTQYLEDIIQSINQIDVIIDPNCEITIEANPEDISYSKLQNLKQCGYNRLSVGLQTLDNTLLKEIGRGHDVNTIFKAMKCIEQTDWKNVSIDLMLDLPKQTMEILENTLENVSKMPFTHLSLYNLTIEPNSAYFRNKQKILPKLPSDKTSLAMLDKAITTFFSWGLHRYEISAFAKENFFSMHNIGYWTYRPYLGFGPSAVSYFEKKRAQNFANFKQYIDAIFANKSAIAFVDDIDEDLKRKEAFLVQLRLIQGVDLILFEKIWGPLDSKTHAHIEHFCQLSYLKINNDHISLSDKGLLFYDTIAADII